MNKVTTVNLNGNAYQVEETGYETLRAYLDEAARCLEQNPDKEEIIADIEAAIADKFRALLGPHKTVVLAREVASVIAAMGPVRDDTTEPAGASQSGPTTADGRSAKGEGRGERADGDEDSGTHGYARRLYRIPDGAMFAGVCNGIGVYFDLDVLLVRIAFAALGLLMSLLGLVASWLLLFPVLAYVLLAILLPTATTPEQRAAARGDPATAQEFIRRARKGYYESVRTFQDPVARQAWKEKCQREFQRWKHAFRQETRSSPVHGSGGWTPPPSGALVPALAVPVLGFAEVVVSILGILGLVLLLTQGSVAGFVPPADVPLWVLIVLYIAAWQIVLWPIKMLRYACLVRVTGNPSRAAPCAPIWGSIVGLAVMAAVVWLLDHYVPGVHDFLMRLPDMLREVGHSLQQWWNGA